MQWVYTVKLTPDWSLVRLKNHLVVEGYSQVYGMDYQNTFQPVAKLTKRILSSLAVTHYWPLHHLDIKNDFLNGVLDKEVYIEQPPHFADYEELEKVCKLKKFCMALSSHRKLGSNDLPLLFGLLVFLVVRRITLCFGDNIKGRCYF